MRAYRKVRIEKYSDWKLTYRVAFKRDRGNEQNNKQHAQLRYVWQLRHVGFKQGKRGLVKAWDWVLERQGCDCSACTGHLELLATLNPERYMALTNPPVPDEPTFFKPKQTHPSVTARKRIAKTINRFAIL